MPYCILDHMQVTYTNQIPSHFTAGGSSPTQQLCHLFYILSHLGPPAGGSQARKHPGQKI